MAVGDLSFAFDPAKGDTPQTVARKRQLAEAIMGSALHTPRDIGEGLSAIGQAIMYRQMTKGADSAEAAGQSGAAKVFGSLFGDQFPSAPASSPMASAASSGASSPSADSHGDQIAWTDAAPYQKALLNTIAGPESGGRYDVIYGGGKFSDFSHHPNQAVRIQTGPNAGRTSSAAGKYQFLGSTYEDQAKKLGLTDFSPASQDKAAWNLAAETYKAKTGQDLATVLQSGDENAIAGVGKVLNPIWTSLPGGIEQGTNTNRFVATYQRALDNGASPAQAAQVAQRAQAKPVQVASLDPAAGIQAADPTARPLPPEYASRGITQEQWDAMNAPDGASQIPALPAQAMLPPQKPTSAQEAIAQAMGGQTLSFPPEIGPEDAARLKALPRQAGAVPSNGPAELDANALPAQQRVAAAMSGPPASPVGPFPGMLEQGNIDLAKRPIVRNPDGSISTVRSMSFEDNSGREVLVPTVSPDGRILSNRDAMELYGKTGQNLGKFDNPEDADRYAEALHKSQEQFYADQRQAPGASSALVQQQPIGGAPMPLMPPSGFAQGQPPINTESQPSSQVGPQPAQPTSAPLDNLPVMAGGTADALPAGAVQQGPSIEQLIQAASNPWLNDAQRGVVGAMLKQKMAAADPATQLEMEKTRLEMEKLRIENQQLLNPQMSPADKARLDFDREKLAADQKKLLELSPGTTVFDQNTRQPVYSAPEKSDVLSPEAFDQKLKLSKAGASSVNVDTKGETEYDKSLGKNLADKTVSIIDAGQQAPNKLATYQLMRQVLPGIYTGAGGDKVLEAKRIAKSLGMDVGDVSDAEFVQAMGNQMALELRNPAGGAGMPGAMSDSDRAFLASMSPGLSKTPEGNQKLLDYRMAVEKRNIDVAQRANDYMNAHDGRLDNNFFADLAKWSAANPLFPKIEETKAAPGGKKPTVIDGYTIEEVQ